MIKHIALVSSKPGMGRQAFIDRYEQGHAPLALRILPPGTFCDYRRNYLIPDGAVEVPHLRSNVSGPDFIDISEFWYPNQRQVDLFVRTLAETDVGEQITRDEADFMIREKITMINVDERASPRGELAPRPAGGPERPAVKAIILGSKLPGISRERFIQRYEEGHAPLALKLLRRNGAPLIADYKRSYPIPGPLFDLPHVEFEPPSPDFDVMTALWFWTAEDYERFLELVSQPAIGEQLAKDEEALFDRPRFRMFLVEEHVTPAEVLAVAGGDCPLVE